LGLQDSLLFDRSAIGGIIADSLLPGFNFNNTSQLLGNSASAESLATREKAAGQIISNLNLGRENNELGFGGLVLSASSESVSVLIRALQEARRINILSRPQIMTLNNQEAFVQVGATVPYITQSNVSVGVISNTITFEDVGFILRVIPRISPDGLVVMDIFADKSQLGPEDEGVVIGVADGTEVRAPLIERQRAQTVVSARDGQTVILGGLIDTTRETTERKVPFFGDLPFLGRLFRSDSVREERTELLIIMTPKIIRGQEDLDAVNSEEFSRMSWCLSDVVEMYGDVGPVGIHHAKIEGEVIYPDLDAYDDSGTPGPNTERIPDEPPTTRGPSAALPPWRSASQQELYPPTPAEQIDTSWPQASTNGAANNDASRVVSPVGFRRNPDDRTPQSRSAIYRFDEVPER